MKRRQRRLRGEGSIRERKGRWEVRFPLPVGPDGKRRRLARYAKSKADALAVLAELREEVKHPRQTDDRLTVAGLLLDRWLPVMELRPATRKVWLCNIQRHIIPVIGTVKLADLKPEHAELVKATALKTLAPRTVLLVRRILAQALQWGEDFGLAAGLSKVTRLSKPPRVDRRNYTWLNPVSAKLFLAAAMTSPYALLYRLTLSLGLRLGEVLALRWADVDLDSRQLTVSHSLQHVNGQLTLTEPKTAASRATFPLDEALTAALTDLKARQAFDKINSPIWLDNWGLVFTDAHGGYVPRSKLRADFRAVLQRADLKPMRFHDLRHSAISILAASGVHAKVMQLFARHSQISTTLNTYTHLAPEQLAQAVTAMERALG